MRKIKLTLEDIDEGTESYFEVLSNATKEAMQQCNESIELSSILKITSFNQNDISLGLNLPFDEAYLLSFASDLDYVCYDSSTVLWNNIVLDSELESRVNFEDEYTESLLFFFRDIEDEVMQLELSEESVLTDEIDIQSFIDDYEYKDLVDCDELYVLVEKALNELQEMIMNQVKEFFDSDEYYDWIRDIEFYQWQYLVQEVKDNGFVEVYI